jgi:uncharacterized membrane protein
MAFLSIVIGLLIAAFFVRWIGLVNLDIWSDEAHSFYVASAPEGVMKALRNDPNLPLYFVLLKGWMAIFGESLASLRGMSLAFSLLGVITNGLVAREADASRRTILWTLLLSALAPLSVYYAQEVRGYALGEWLIGVGLLTAIRALRRGGALNWAAHGAAVAAAAYTHNVLILACAGYWLAAPLMRISRRQVISMAAAHAGALLAAIPVLGIVLHSRQSQGTAWIADLWRQTHPSLAILKSLELIGLGGGAPPYLAMLPTAVLWRILAGVLALAGIGAAFWRQRRTEGGQEQGWQEFGRFKWLLTTFAVWPLLALWLYSVVRQPIYVVGRYDLFAQPALLLLLAAGFSRLQSRLQAWRGKWIAAIPAGLVALVTLAAIAGRWTFAQSVQAPFYMRRAAYLKAHLQPGDALICTAHEALPMLYYLRAWKLPLELLTFPTDTLQRPGIFLSESELNSRRGTWPEGARRVLDETLAAGHFRLWICLDSDLPQIAGKARRERALLFAQVTRDSGWRPMTADPREQEIQWEMFMMGLTHD